jgi:hypothetical protein
MIIFENKDFSVKLNQGEKPALVVTPKAKNGIIKLFNGFITCDGVELKIRAGYCSRPTVFYTEKLSLTVPIDFEFTNREVRITKNLANYLSNPSLENLLSINKNRYYIFDENGSIKASCNCKDSALFYVFVSKFGKRIAFKCEAGLEKFKENCIFENLDIKQVGSHLILTEGDEPWRLDTLGWIVLHARLLDNPKEFNLTDKEKDEFYNWDKKKMERFSPGENWVYYFRAKRKKI